MPKRRLILVRHGQTEFNAEGRMQGQLDTELSEAGREQARAAGVALAGWNVSRVVASDLKRAKDTAELISAGWDCVVETDPRLRETDLGAWQGTNAAEVEESYPGQRSFWRHDPTWRPPQGESRVEVASRAHEVVAELLRDGSFDAGDVVLVAHGGTIGALTSRLLEIPESDHLVFTGLGNVCWAQFDARPRVERDPNLRTPPAVDGTSVPQMQTAEGPWWESVRWHLSGWNVGITAAAPMREASPDEGGEEAAR